VAQLSRDGAVSASKGYGGGRSGAAVAVARPVVLVRYRPEVAGETARMVHLVPLPTAEQAGAVEALCGAALLLPNMETVTPGEGMPCTACVINHLTRTTPTAEVPTGGPDIAGAAALAIGGACYQQWGWPVMLHRNQVRLSLHPDVSAVAIPLSLCTKVIKVLTLWRCAPPVLAHPDTPEHRIVLTGQRFGVRLPWPAQVHEITGDLLLPPTLTARGAITWARAPREDSLLLCREIDLFGAVRTALSDSSSSDSPRREGDPP
jgi:hypothetical protein